MDNKTRIENLPETEYQELFGVKKPTFDTMLEILVRAHKEAHKEGGRPVRLEPLDRLIITLCYYREYRAMRHIAWDYGVSKSRVSNAIKWTEETLMADGRFALPDKQWAENMENKIAIVVIDAMECETERPKKNKRRAIQGSKNATR